MRLELIGVYDVGEPPWVLVELMLGGVEVLLDVSTFQLADPLLPEDNWQVAYDESVLDPSGTHLLEQWSGALPQPDLLTGDFRLCFFLYVDCSRTLSTPTGPVVLPAASPKPDRLAFLEFEEP